MTMRSTSLSGICKAAAGVLLISCSCAASAQAELFPPAARDASVQSALRNDAQRIVAVDTQRLQSMQPGEEASITTPAGVSLVVVHDRSVTGYGGGKVWIGHLRDFDGNYPVVISTFDGSVSAGVELPGAKLRLQGDERAAVLTEVNAMGERELVPDRDDVVRAPSDPLADLARSFDQTAAAPAAAAAGAQIDLLLLYSPALLSKFGSFSAVVSRANQLVALANTIYTNSGMTTTLRLVEVQLLNAAYADASDDSTALGQPSPASGLAGDANVAALRNRYGADLVTLLRPFVASVCGLAYLPSGFSAGSAQYGYSVVEDGSNGNSYCDNSSMTHELGHNMGAAHDVYTTITYGGAGSSINGTPAYNRGYCNGSAGTIMSYGAAAGGCSPLVYVFSNPALSSSNCKGGACGVPSNQSYTAIGTSTSATGADSVSAINANAPSIAAWRAPPSLYTPLLPARVLDTRPGNPTTDGQYAGGGAIASAATLNLGLSGRGGLPVADMSAVVLNVTAVAPGSPGYITVWPSGQPQPQASNLNLSPGLVIPNLVIAKLGSNAQISIYNGSATSTNILADVQGWFPATASYTPLSPVRLLDTRAGGTTADGQDAGAGAVASAATRNLTVTNRGGIPADASAVVLNVTAVAPPKPGYLTVWPAGQSQPTASNLNLNPGMVLPNLVIAKIGSNGQVSIYNGSQGPTDVIADAQGWFPAASSYTSLSPARLLDTRSGGTTADGQFAGGGAVAAAGTLNLTVTSRGGVPANAGAVVLNVTAVAPSKPGYITVWPAGQTQALASNLNLSPGLIIPNLVIAKVGSNGQVSIYNGSQGATHILADVQGWFPATP